MVSDRSEVTKFLSKVKEIIDHKDGFQFIRRKKNLDALDRNGFTISDVINYIKSLEVKDYYKGPEEDHLEDYSHSWWFFGKEINNKIFYIKIRVVEKGDKRVVCLSFHEAKYEINNFPYK